MHEKYIETVKNACRECLHEKKIDGLLFNYLHFYGTYDYVADSRKWYKHETRIIRNDKTIRSYRDAQGFRRGNKKIRVAATEAYIYHYGWVKSPEKMKAKHKEVAIWWNPDDASLNEFRQSENYFDFSQVDAIKRFSSSHPEVMRDRIKNKNWELILDEKKIRMKGKHLILHYFEKTTGIRLFSFSNHRIVRKIH